MSEFFSFEWDGSEPVECRHCKIGWRHFVGNCVLCGCGPSPAALEIPQTPERAAKALASVGIFGGKAQAAIEAKFGCEAA